MNYKKLKIGNLQDDIYYPEDSSYGKVYLNGKAEQNGIINEIFFIPKEKFKNGTATDNDGYMFLDICSNIIMTLGIYSLDIDILKTFVGEFLERCKTSDAIEVMNDYNYWFKELKEKYYRPGTHVFWKDPANETSGTYEIWKIPSPEMVYLSNGITELEAPLDELYRHIPGRMEKNVFFNKFDCDESSLPTKTHIVIKNKISIYDELEELQDKEAHLCERITEAIIRCMKRDKITSVTGLSKWSDELYPEEEKDKLYESGQIDIALSFDDVHLVNLNAMDKSFRKCIPCYFDGLELKDDRLIILAECDEGEKPHEYVIENPSASELINILDYYECATELMDSIKQHKKEQSS